MIRAWFWANWDYLRGRSEQKFGANAITSSIKYCDKWYEKVNLFTHLRYENVPYNTKNCKST